MAEKAPVLGDTLGEGVLGAGHVAGNWGVGGGCEGEKFRHAPDRKLWTMVQSQEHEEGRRAGRRMRIGEFAEAAGVSVDAVRFYERRGVLHPVPRTSSGYRIFDERDLDRVRMARQFQQLGLTVEEVVGALSAHDLGDATCTSERWRLEEVESRVEAQMAELRRTRRLIREALAACAAGQCEFTATR